MSIDTGLYDSDTGESLKADRVVNITGDDRTVTLVFTKAKRGRIVQVVDGPARIHYFYDEPGGRQMMEEDAARFGFTPRDFRTLALAHAPK